MNKLKKSQLMEKLLDVMYEAIKGYDLQQLDSSKIVNIMDEIEAKLQEIIYDFKESVDVSDIRKDAMIDWNIESLEKLLQDWKDI